MSKEVRSSKGLVSDASDMAEDGWPREPAEFGAAVLRTRKALGLTGEQLAQLARVTYNTIRNIEGRYCRSSSRAAVIRALGPRPLYDMAEDGWPSDPAEFGRAVYRTRKALRMSPYRLARLAGVTYSTVRNIEENHHHCLSSNRAAMIQALGPVPL
jgi:transcriptional regulator with XRE-family HTH domain